MGNCSTCTCTDKNEVQNFEVQVGTGDTGKNGNQRMSSGVDASGGSYGQSNGPKKNNGGTRKVSISASYRVFSNSDNLIFHRIGG
jgi:hypothetical protein